LNATILIGQRGRRRNWKRERGDRKVTSVILDPNLQIEELISIYSVVGCLRTAKTNKNYTES
jgi:hypothetical protein